MEPCKSVKTERNKKRRIHSFELESDTEEMIDILKNAEFKVKTLVNEALRLHLPEIIAANIELQRKAGETVLARIRKARGK